MKYLEETANIEVNEFDFTNYLNVVGLLANIVAIIYALGPITIFILIHKKVLKASDTPYMIMVTLITMSTFWVSYGILKPDNKFFLILPNTINVVFNLFYLALFFYYRAERKFLKSLIYTIPSILVTLGFFFIFTYAIAIIEVSQYTACVFNITIFAAPGQNIVNIFLLKIFNFFD